MPVGWGGMTLGGTKAARKLNQRDQQCASSSLADGPISATWNGRLNEVP